MPKVHWITILLLPIIAIISIIDSLTDMDSEQNQRLNRKIAKHRIKLEVFDAPTPILVQPKKPIHHQNRN